MDIAALLLGMCLGAALVIALVDVHIKLAQRKTLDD